MNPQELRAAELRVALHRLPDGIGHCRTCECSLSEAEADKEAREPIYNAARTIALPILEADPELVERIAKAMHKAVANRNRSPLTWEAAYPEEQTDFLNVAGTVLAAISTPTPVENS